MRMHTLLLLLNTASLGLGRLSLRHVVGFAFGGFGGLGFLVSRGCCCGRSLDTRHDEGEGEQR